MFFRHLKNLAYLFSSKVLSSFFAFLAQIIIARYLTQEDYGTISFYIILINISASIVGFGLGNFWLRRFAVEGLGAERWINPTIKSILGLIIVVLPIYILIPFFILGAKSIYISLTLSPLLIYQGLGSIVTASFQIQNQYKKLSNYLTIKNSVLFLAACILFIFEFKHFIILYGLLSLVLMVYSFTLILQLKKTLQSSNHLENASSNKITIKEVLLSAWPFGVQGTLYMLYYQVDIIIITILLGTVSTGLYNAAFNVLSLIFIFPSLLFQLYLLPRSNIWIAKKETKKINFVRKKLSLIVFLIGIFTAVIFYYLSNFIITLLYGGNFEESIFLFNVLILSIPFRFVSNSLGLIFASEKMVSYKVYIQGGGALLNIILNIILIMEMGIFGAAVSTVVTEILVVFLMYIFSSRVQKEEVKK
ncbi:MAG: oligosaccharide flippase family protein [Bacillota bacterium]